MTADDCDGCAGTGECANCVDADSYACSECLCTGECPDCDGTGEQDADAN
ncbi:hypothetical protein [Kitasatospora sp. NBC_01302]|nr:hypothetical protein OG294_13845 [Kitasatospora sp. NBC_01302]